MPPLLQCDLSIIVPVYNLERFIQPLINSLLEQEHHYNVEHIFVMNNCSDRSEEVVRASGIDCRILHEPKQGCGNARNTGLESAVGEYIWFLDGDDYLLSKLAIQEALDNAKGIDILRIPFKSNAFNRDYFSMVWQYIFRREFIKEFRFPDIQPCEDDVFTERVLFKAGYNRYTYKQLPCLQDPLYYYNYLREGSNMYRVNILRERI